MTRWFASGRAERVERDAYNSANQASWKRFEELDKKGFVKFRIDQLFNRISSGNIGPPSGQLPYHSIEEVRPERLLGTDAGGLVHLEISGEKGNAQIAFEMAADPTEGILAFVTIERQQFDVVARNALFLSATFRATIEFHVWYGPAVEHWRPIKRFQVVERIRVGEPVYATA